MLVEIEHFRTERYGWLAAALACLLGCSVVVDADRKQCRTDADCTARGPAFADSVCKESFCEAADPRWSCLGSPLAPAAGPGPFDVTMHVQDLLTQQPLSGVDANVCTKVDVECSSPRFSTKSDAAGLVALSINAAFSGFVALTSDEIVPTRYFFNPPINADREIAALSLSRPVARAALLGQLGAMPERGDILLTATDCQGAPAEGVKFALTPSSDDAIQYYLVNGLPSPASGSTDSTGYGGFANVIPGTWTVTGQLADGRALPPLSLTVAATTITWSRMVPEGQP